MKHIAIANVQDGVGSCKEVSSRFPQQIERKGLWNILQIVESKRGKHYLISSSRGDVVLEKIVSVYMATDNQNSLRANVERKWDVVPRLCDNLWLERHL